MFRSLGKSKIALILAILFGVSLLFFKSGSRYSNFFNSDSVVATVSGTPISNTKFIRSLEMNIKNFNNIFGKELNGEEIRSYNISGLALNALIANAVFENEYDNINFFLDEKVIAQKTQERIPQLYNSSNKLDELYLKSFLNQQKLKIEDIVQIINFETRDSYFTKSFFKINYPRVFSNKIDSYNTHQREISFVNFTIDSIDIDELLKGELPKENWDELEKYYNKNISQYMSEEKRDVQYIVINKDIFRDNFKPKESEISEYFFNNKELFLEAEKRSFFQFNFKDKDDAISFKNETQNLSNEEILRYSIKQKIKYNEFKDLQSEEMLNELSDSLFKLKLNQQSEIIETSLANHVLILQSIKQPYQPKLDDVKNDIIETITDIDSTNYYKDISNKISDRILSGDKINDIAGNFDLKIDTIDSLTQDLKYIKEKDKLFFSNLIQKSFSSNKDFVSDIIVVNQNLSYFFNVTDIQISEPIIIDNIKDEVFSDWKYTKKIEKIKNEIEINKEKLEYIEGIKKNYDTELKQILISNNSQELPLGLVNKIFKTTINQNLEYIDEKNVYIAIVDKVIISKKSNKENRITLVNDLKASFGEELMKRKRIKINEALVSALTERY